MWSNLSLQVLPGQLWLMNEQFVGNIIFNELGRVC